MNVERNVKKGKETVWSEFYKNIQVPVLLISKDSTIIDINKSFGAMFGYSQDDVLKKSLLEITDPEDRIHEVNNFIDTFYGVKKKSALVKRFIKKSNDSIQVHQYTFPIDDEYNETLTAIIYLIPIKLENPEELEKFIPLINKLKSANSFSDLKDFCY